MAFDTTVVDDNEDTPLNTTETETQTEVPQDTAEQAEPEQSNPDEKPSDDETAEGEKPDDKTEEDGETEKKGGRASERIKQLVAEKKAYEAELERLRQQVPQSITTDDGQPKPPSMDDFDIDSDDGLEAYFKAQTEYENQLEEWQFDQKLQKREQARVQQQREAEITDSFKQRFEKNPKFKEDFVQLQTLIQDKPINADPSQLYQGDELMDLLEEVAGNPDLYYEIAGLPEQAQYAKFGEIQASIKARKNKPTARQSKAPPPPNHTKSNAPITKSPYDKSDDDFLVARGLA